MSGCSCKPTFAAPVHTSASMDLSWGRDFANNNTSSANLRFVRVVSSRVVPSFLEWSEHSFRHDVEQQRAEGVTLLHASFDVENSACDVRPHFASLISIELLQEVRVALGDVLLLTATPNCFV